MENRVFSWNELMTSDMEAASAFYSEVVGWTTNVVSIEDPHRPPNPGEASYTFWMNGDQMVGGAMKIDDLEMENTASHWMSYVTVENVDEVAKKALANGGKVLTGPIEVAKIGRFYIIEDPQGAALGIATYTDQEA